VQNFDAVALNIFQERFADKKKYLSLRALK
jgi:hypothetical protein